MSLLEDFVTHPWGSTTISLKHEGFLLDDLKLLVSVNKPNMFLKMVVGLPKTSNL